MWFLLGLPVGWLLRKFFAEKSGKTVVGANAKNMPQGHDTANGYRDWNTPYDKGWNDALDGNSSMYSNGNADYKSGYDAGQAYKQ